MTIQIPDDPNDFVEIKSVADMEALVSFFDSPTCTLPSLRDYAYIPHGRPSYLDLTALPQWAKRQLKRYRLFVHRRVYTHQLGQVQHQLVIDRSPKTLSLRGIDVRYEKRKLESTIAAFKQDLLYTSASIERHRRKLIDLDLEVRSRLKALPAESYLETIRSWPDVIRAEVGPLVSIGSELLPAGALGILFLPVLFYDDVGGVIPTAPTWYYLDSANPYYEVSSISPYGIWSHPHINSRGKVCFGDAAPQVKNLARVNDVRGLLGVLRQLRLGWDSHSEYESGWYKNGWRLWYSCKQGNNPWEREGWDGSSYQDSKTGEIVAIDDVIPTELGSDLVRHIGTEHKILYPTVLLELLESDAYNDVGSALCLCGRSISPPVNCPYCPSSDVRACVGCGLLSSSCNCTVEGELPSEPIKLNGRYENYSAIASTSNVRCSEHERGLEEGCSHRVIYQETSGSWALTDRSLCQGCFTRYRAVP